MPVGAQQAEAHRERGREREREGEGEQVLFVRLVGMRTRLHGRTVERPGIVNTISTDCSGS